MKQRIALLTGLTAVFLLILLTSCTTPTTPEATVETAVSPTPTSQPTATTASTATPEPTATPTAAEQANQLLLNNGRFTTLLDNLTQEIGRDLSDTEQAQVLALARALWLPGQLDESDWRPDPAGVTLHWRPDLDGREGPVLRVVETQPDSPYAAGALIFWQGERLLSLTPSQPGSNIEYTTIHNNGLSLSTWIETDVNGELIRFVDNTNPDSPTYYKWVNPQDLREDGTFSIFMIQDTDPRNGDAKEFWWANGGEPVRITTAPDGTPIKDYIGDGSVRYLGEVNYQGEQVLAIIFPANKATTHIYDSKSGEWIEKSLFYIEQISVQEVLETTPRFIHAEPTNDMPGFSIHLTEDLVKAIGHPIYPAVVTVDGPNPNIALNTMAAAINCLAAREQGLFQGNCETAINNPSVAFHPIEVLVTNPNADPGDLTTHHTLETVSISEHRIVVGYSGEDLRDRFMAHADDGGGVYRGYYLHEKGDGSFIYTRVIYLGDFWLGRIANGDAWEISNRVNSELIGSVYNPGENMGGLKRHYEETGSLKRYDVNAELREELRLISSMGRTFRANNQEHPMSAYQFISDKDRSFVPEVYGEYKTDPPYLPSSE